MPSLRDRHFNSVISSLTNVFYLADFVDISYLTRFLITCLVTLAELCSLRCYEVFVLKFWQRVPIFVSFLSANFVCSSSILAELSVIFNFTIFHSISLFRTQYHFFALVKLHCSLINRAAMGRARFIIYPWGYPWFIF